jgi:hypothetical protein
MSILAFQGRLSSACQQYVNLSIGTQFTRLENRMPERERFDQAKFVRVLKIEGKCSCLRAKAAYISGHLPRIAAGNWAECSTESASIIECWVQGSIMNHDRFPNELVLRVHCTLEMEIDALGGTSSCLRREYAVLICSKLLGRASRDGFPVGKQEALVRHGNPFVA